MVKNWIHEIFNDVSNVEEGIEALHAIERFSSRPNLRETLKNKWIQVTKSFYKLAVVAFFLYRFFTGLENVWRRTGKHVDVNV